MRRKKIRPLSIEEKQSESAVGDFLAQCVENIESGNINNANDPIYMVGTPKHQTCINYFMDELTAGEIKTKGRLLISSYSGNLGWLRDYLDKERHYSTVISEALFDIYFKNPHARPVENQCHFFTESSKPGVEYGRDLPHSRENLNCMTKMIEYSMDQGNVNPVDMLSHFSNVPEIMVKGVCDIITEDDGSVSRTRKKELSCLDLVLDRAEKFEDKLRFTRFLSFPKINLVESRCFSSSIAANKTKDGVSCFERILEGAISDRPEHIAIRELVKSWLSKTSVCREFFNYTDKRAEYSIRNYPVTGYQFLIEQSVGSGGDAVGQILSHSESGFKTATCYTDVGAEPCLDTVINEAGRALERGDEARAEVFLSQAIRQPDLFASSLDRATYTINTAYGTSSVSLVNHILNSMFPRGAVDPSRAKFIFDNVDKYTCVGDWGPTTCTDSMISSGYSRNLDYINSKTDLSQKLCRDRFGRDVPCVDKLLQRAEIYNYYAQRSLTLSDRIKELMSRSSKSTQERTKIELANQRKLAEQEREFLENLKKRYNLIAGMTIGGAIYGSGKYDLTQTMCKQPVSYGSNPMLDPVETEEITSMEVELSETLDQIERSRSEQKKRILDIQAEYMRTKIRWTKELQRGINSGSELAQACAIGMISCNEQLVSLLRKRESAKTEGTRIAIAQKLDELVGEMKYIEGMHSISSDPSPQTVSCFQRSIDISESNIQQWIRHGFPDENIPAAFANYVNSGKLDLIPSRCLDSDRKKTACISRYIDFLYNVREVTPSSPPGLFRLKEVTQSACKDINGENIPCISYAIAKIGPSMVDPKHSLDILLNPEFKKILKIKVDTGGGRSISLGDMVCKNVTVSNLAGAIQERRGTYDTEVDVGVNYSGSGKALEMLASCHCTDIEDNLERKMCLDYFCLEKSYKVTKSTPWSSEFLSDPAKAYEKYGFDGSEDPLDITGVYDVRYNRMKDPSALQKYSDVVMSSLPVLKQEEGKNGIDYITIVEPDYVYYKLGDSGSKYIQVGTSKTGHIPDAIRVPDIEGSDYKIRIVTEDGRESITDISEFASDETVPHDIRLAFDKHTALLSEIKMAKPKAGDTRLKLVISNRPMDFMRASTCQKWSSCYSMTAGENRNSLLSYLRSGAYVAYLAPDEHSLTWLSRSWILPLHRDAENNHVDGKYCVSIQRPYGEISYKNLIMDALATVIHESGHNHSGCPQKISSAEDIRVKRYPHMLSRVVSDEYYSNCVKEANGLFENNKISEASRDEKLSLCKRNRDAVRSSNANTILGSSGIMKHISAELERRLQEVGILRYWIDATHYNKSSRGEPDYYGMRPYFQDSMMADIVNRQPPDFVSIRRRKSLSEFPKKIDMKAWV